MEELKILVGMVAGLPNTALFVLGGYLMYKLSVVASVYATIKFVVAKLVEGYMAKVAAPKPSKTLADLAVINEDTAKLLHTQLCRLKTTSYLHESDVRKLKQLLDDAKIKE